ncbi:molybdate ABC transporter substrate-binding protein [Stenotrophomonas rhizophila]|uniref:Molybdate transport system substrate-binding protein n=2 Tax=Stenotrophomonas rhizophila TaxID=216778 RepID=A0AAW5PH63_9GAMM|nr:molybdate ABC transporter substrate-binding protein [Stenotrophomonas rhizophila]MCS4279224.1 molybdate transport system substrate-binding protein [Stenotrophomonas rhizophila]
MRVVFCLLAALFSVQLHAADLTVSAASSLTESFREIAAVYQNERPGTKVDLNFAASGVLLQQITRGAPVDVLATADMQTMDLADARHLLMPASRQTFATNRLVVVVPPATAAAMPADLAALAAKKIQRVAIGNPDSVPVGRYAQQALKEAGLWQQLSDKVLLTQNVRQSLDYVARGEVDAGFVYASDARVMPGRVIRAFEVPLRAPIRYPIAAISGSRHERDALDFIAFVRSARGQAILKRHGFSAP